MPRKRIDLRTASQLPTPVLRLAISIRAGLQGASPSLPKSGRAVASGRHTGLRRRPVRRMEESGQLANRDTHRQKKQPEFSVFWGEVGVSGPVLRTLARPGVRNRSKIPLVYSTLKKAPPAPVANRRFLKRGADPGAGNPAAAPKLAMSWRSKGPAGPLAAGCCRPGRQEGPTLAHRGPTLRRLGEVGKKAKLLGRALTRARRREIKPERTISGDGSGSI
jgi:hypothetical protein